MSLSREPLLVRTLLTALVTALVHVAVVQGWVSVDIASEQTVAGIVDAIGAIIAAFWARQAVTPVADPVLQETITHRVHETIYQENVSNTVEEHPETIDNTSSEYLPDFD